MKRLYNAISTYFVLVFFLAPFSATAQLAEADTIIRICKGEQVELKGWHHTIECPCAATGLGPADCFPFAQPGGIWLVEGQRICDNSCIDITVQPEMTTLYTHQTPPFQCPAIFDPNAPLGPPPPSFPGGEKINILVVVDENCATAPIVQTGSTLTNPIFSNYVWLADKVNLTDCSVESITVYESGNYEYVYVQAGHRPHKHLDGANAGANRMNETARQEFAPHQDAGVPLDSHRWCLCLLEKKCHGLIPEKRTLPNPKASLIAAHRGQGLHK